MFLHKSLSDKKFQNNKKLNLLKNGLITPSQFVALLQPSDPYIMLGSSIVDKEKQDEFMKQWKSNIHNISNIQQKPKITSQEFIKNLSVIALNFPETVEIIKEFNAKINNASCKICTKNRYFLLIASIIKEHFQDGREYNAGDKLLFEKILNKYFPFDFKNGKVSLDVTSYFDNTWIQPDSIINVGYDLIDGLTNCFECAKKHLSRAKALYEELYLGYPDHLQMMFNEFTEANKDIEEAYSLYWDILGQLDMSSSELVGQIIDIPVSYREEIIELANVIRKARIAYQDDITQVPDWNKLRIEIQKYQNKINKQIKNKDEQK